MLPLLQQAVRERGKEAENPGDEMIWYALSTQY
jgi:hypothetical protein